MILFPLFIGLALGLYAGTNLIGAVIMGDNFDKFVLDVTQSCPDAVIGVEITTKKYSIQCADGRKVAISKY